MGDIKRISPQEASAKLAEGWTYVDVRTTQEFEAGHPAGALNVPICAPGRWPNPDFVRVMNAAFPKDAKIVVGCKAGGRSAARGSDARRGGFHERGRPARRLGRSAQPFGQIVEPGWHQAGLPREDGVPAGRSWADLRGKTQGSGK